MKYVHISQDTICTDVNAECSKFVQYHTIHGPDNNNYLFIPLTMEMFFVFSEFRVTV